MYLDSVLFHDMFIEHLASFLYTCPETAEVYARLDSDGERTRSAVAVAIIADSVLFSLSAADKYDPGDMDMLADRIAEALCRYLESEYHMLGGDLGLDFFSLKEEINYPVEERNITLKWVPRHPALVSSSEAPE